MQTYQQQAKKKLVATVISLFIIAGIITYADHLKVSGTKTTPTVTSSSTTPSSPSTPATGSTTTSSGFKDGTYTASSSYYVPHGNENIKVTLTLSSGVITDASIQNSEGDPTSASFQENFASVYKSYVVGKKISGLQLAGVAGASDTTQGFNDALKQITSKSQA